MGGIRRLIGWSFTGVCVCVCMLIAAPAGGAASPSTERYPVPLGDPSSSSQDPVSPTLILVPAVVSAGALVTVIGEGFVSCVAARADIASSGNGDLTVAGNVVLFLDGIDPITSIHLDEDFGFSTSLQIAQSVSPGSHRIVGRCADTGGDTGSADVVVPAPSVPVDDMPSRNPADVTAAGPISSASPIPSASTVLSGQLVGAALAVPGDLSSGIAAESQSPPSDAPVPDENPSSKAAAAEPTLSAAGPAPMGTLVAALALVGAVLIAPAAAPFVLQARRGPKWVRSNVRAVANVAPAGGIDLAPRTEDWWPPSSVVRFNLNVDSGTQAITEEK